MSQPPPAKTPGPLVIPTTTKRDAIVAIICGLIVLVFVGYGVFYLSQPAKHNKLTGKIVEKVFIPQHEQTIEFSGRTIKSAKETAGLYSFKVRVESLDRIFEVPVEKPTYDAKKVGDSMTFLKPPSER